jgi:transposase
VEAVKEEAGLNENHPNVRVMFCDEGRFGLIDAMSGCWAPPGVRPEIPMKFTRQYLYGFCAVSPVDGRMVSLVLPWANTQAMSVFLDEVSRTFANDLVLLYMDQAGWHKSRGLEIPGNIRIEFVPPYSPELNPVEHIWDELREKWFKNRCFADLEQVEEQLCEGLKDLEDNPDRVAGITGFPWILTATPGGN